MNRVTFYVDGFNFYYGLKTKKKIVQNGNKLINGDKFAIVIYL